MVQVLETNSLLGELDFRDEVEAQRSLSRLVIPAMPGEYYSYFSQFTDKEPIYVFMKCKANKARTIASLEELGSEANLLFLFGNSNHVQVCSIRAAHASGLLGDSVNGKLFGETWIVPARITAETFYELRSRKDAVTLVETCRSAFSENREISIALEPGMVIATMTDGGKYGLFFVRGLTPISIQIDACHILI